MLMWLYLYICCVRIQSTHLTQFILSVGHDPTQNAIFDAWIGCVACTSIVVAFMHGTCSWYKFGLVERARLYRYILRLLRSVGACSIFTACEMCGMSRKSRKSNDKRQPECLNGMGKAQARVRLVSSYTKLKVGVFGTLVVYSHWNNNHNANM